MWGTFFQLPQRASIAFALWVPFSSYSVDVGSFCICLATMAQSPNSESIPRRCFLFASIPHAISAFVYVVKLLRTHLRPTGVIVFNSVRVGTRPSLFANPWIAVIISSLLIAFFSSRKMFLDRSLGPVQARFWLAWVEPPPPAMEADFVAQSLP